MEETRVKRLHTITPRLTREQAEKMLAQLPKPDLSKITAEVIEETLRWMKKDRSEDW